MRVGFVPLAVLAAAMVPAVASAITLVKTSDPGYYNNAIGTVLNDTNGGETGPFPVSDDAARNFATAPDLSAASSALGNWLTSPGSLNGNWQNLASIPNSWAVGTEVAVIYKFDTLGATNIVASFGVDNGIFVWLDGQYLFGARGPGGVSPGEYVVPVGNLTAGTHYLQLLLEDHGATNGYDVSITADTFLPNSVPEPSSMSLFAISGFGIGVAGWLRRRRAGRSVLPG